MKKIGLMLCLSCVLIVQPAKVFCASPQDLKPRVVDSASRLGPFTGAETVVDGNVNTELLINTPNDQVSVVIDLGENSNLESVLITGGSKPVPFLQAIAVSPDQKIYREVLPRYVNLAMGESHPVTKVSLQRSAIGRYVRLIFRASQEGQGIAEVSFAASPNIPERHMMWWGTPTRLKEDLVDQMDFLEKDLRLTDIWLDFIDTAFPQSNPNAGLDTLANSGALEQLEKRGIRYWLSEHEAFPSLVNSPEELRDDARFNYTTARMRELYSKAKQMGFFGIVFDAEDYDLVSPETKEKYKPVVDFVDVWTFKDEFGYAGYYYQRGLEIGKAIKESHGGPLLQVYEARMYAGTPGGRDGNYWFLKGISNSGVEVWIATEKTYGAGNSEISFPDASEHLIRWFVPTAEHVVNAYAAFPFATRVLPGFHPWNHRLRTPMYLPKYLDEQLAWTEKCAPGCWLYFEGNSFAGDPRRVVSPQAMEKYGVSAEDYLRVLRAHPTSKQSVSSP